MSAWRHSMSSTKKATERFGPAGGLPWAAPAVVALVAAGAAAGPGTVTLLRPPGAIPVRRTMPCTCIRTSGIRENRRTHDHMAKRRLNGIAQLFLPIARRACLTDMRGVRLLRFALSLGSTSARRYGGIDVARKKRFEANAAEEIRTGMGGGGTVFISGRSVGNNGWAGCGCLDAEDRAEP